MSAIKWFMPKAFWRPRPGWRKGQVPYTGTPQPCRGAARAARRRLERIAEGLREAADR